MRWPVLPAFAFIAVIAPWADAYAAESWHAELVATNGRVATLTAVAGEVRMATNAAWHRVELRGGRIKLQPAAAPRFSPLPPDALPDARIAIGERNIARAWLAEPTRRYDHGVLGDAIEAARLVIEASNGTRSDIRLGPDAVFEDIEPRIADLDGDGRDEVVVVKSYLKSGSALAVVGERNGRLRILAETPPIGRSHRWLNPAGIADFDGDGRPDIALVKMPHAVGRLELWSWQDDRLKKSAELADVSNHVIGSRVLKMSTAADFDGDGIVDLAIPSFDRQALRLLALAPQVKEIARVPLPARAVTEIHIIRDDDGRPLILVGVEGGRLVAIRR
jgi:FG-GAP-like repeat